MTIVRNCPVRECAATTEFHFQTGTAGDIGKAAATHAAKYHRSVKADCIQMAGTAKVNLHKSVTDTIRCDGGSPRKIGENL
ncbi:MAG: hypothetical protein J6X65_00090, partial [Bacteroidales bacterium]|nr:hypothetical protein [Bacteroidales bacterium]